MLFSTGTLYLTKYVVPVHNFGLGSDYIKIVMLINTMRSDDLGEWLPARW